MTESPAEQALAGRIARKALRDVRAGEPIDNAVAKRGPDASMIVASLAAGMVRAVLRGDCAEADLPS
jgi:hypothetical protein